jgi:CheY-like chemotaxis protein
VTSTSPGLWRTRVDPGQLEQVIVNLTVNARDAMPGGGRLVISTSNVDLGPAEARAYTEGTSGRYVRISVSDSGVGMTSSILAHLFEPFFTTKDVGKGTGLGLSTVYGIVHQSHGFIHAESEPGHGSTFHVFLPAEFPPDAAIANLAAAPQATTQMPRASDETVLVVEDEQQLRALLETRLASEGFRVLTAADGQEALEVAAQHPGRIDVLVSDIVMPRMGGLQMAGPFRDRHPDALVVFMSGYSDEAVARSIELGQAAAFVQKPEHVSGLPTLLRQLLDGRGKHQGAPGVA